MDHVMKHNYYILNRAYILEILKIKDLKTKIRDRKKVNKQDVR